MSNDSSFFVKRVRHLSQALVISGTINITILAFFLYWIMGEERPRPYCELKPASIEEQQIPLADHRETTAVLRQLSQLSCTQLAHRLTRDQLIENGYAERDLALACLIAFHHFDLARALPKNEQPQQKRLLAWKRQEKNSPVILVVFPDLTEKHFNTILQFVKTEHWPLTAEGLFLALQEQRKSDQLNHQLVDTFVLTPEFWMIELLLNRSEYQVKRSDILTLLLEGDWTNLKRFIDQQRQVHDSSTARRQKFLLDYLKAGSKTAANLLLKMDWDFAVKKLNDAQVIEILSLMSQTMEESVNFAKEMLSSPRSSEVWKVAAGWLYTQVGEKEPKQWNYQEVLTRFSSEKRSSNLVSNTLLPVAPINTPANVFTKKALPNQTTFIVAKPIEKKNFHSLTSNKPQGVKTQLGQKQKYYVVQQGDSLWKISRKFSVRLVDLKDKNGLQSDVVKPGMTLQIPESTIAISNK